MLKERNRNKSESKEKDCSAFRSVKDGTATQKRTALEL